MLFHKKRPHIPWFWIIVVILLTIVIVVLLQGRQSRERDLRRLADLKQMQTMLHYHYELYETYPTINQFTCFSDIEGLFEALVPWLVTLPQDPLAGLEPDEPKKGCYNYRSDGQEFKLRAALEKNNFSMEQDGGASSEWFELYSTGARDWK